MKLIDSIVIIQNVWWLTDGGFQLTNTEIRFALASVIITVIHQHHSLHTRNALNMQNEFMT